jgi:hypothetical protein
MIQGAVSVIRDRIIEGTWYYRNEAEKRLAELKAEKQRLELEKTYGKKVIQAYMETDQTNMFD